jgi:hypothetical protein
VVQTPYAVRELVDRKRVEAPGGGDDPERRRLMSRCVES